MYPAWCPGVWFWRRPAFSCGGFCLCGVASRRESRSASKSLCEVTKPSQKKNQKHIFQNRQYTHVIITWISSHNQTLAQERSCSRRDPRFSYSEAKTNVCRWKERRKISHNACMITCPSHLLIVSPYVALMSCCRRFLMFLRSHWFLSFRSNTSSINSNITLSGILSSTCTTTQHLWNSQLQL